MVFQGRRPVLIALAAEAAAAAAVVIAVQVNFQLAEADMPLAAKLLIAAAAAGGVALVLRANWRWAAFLAVLPTLFVGALRLDLPVWVPAAGLAALVLLMRNSLGQRVPLYLSNAETLEKLCSLHPSDEPVRFADLGCGLAAAPIALASHNRHPDSAFIGIENAPLPYLAARWNAWRTGDTRINVSWGSIWKADLGRYDTVYAFLSPHPMPRLYAKARAEMRAGARLISNSFAVPNAPPDREIAIESGRATGLLIWTMPGPEKGPDAAGPVTRE